MKKHHWHIFRHEKLFEKHSQPHCQTRYKPSITVKKKTNRTHMYSSIHRKLKAVQLKPPSPSYHLKLES